MDAVRSKTTSSPPLIVLLPPETAAIRSELSTVIVCPTPTGVSTGHGRGLFAQVGVTSYKKQYISTQAIGLTGTVGLAIQQRR